MRRAALAAVLLALAGAARAEAEGAGVESLIRWEWRIRWLQDVPELNFLVRNQTDRGVSYELRLQPGEIPCRAGPSAHLDLLPLSGEISPHGWSHRSAPLLDLRGKLPCEVPLQVVAHFAGGREPAPVRVSETTLAIAERTQAPPPGPVGESDVSLHALVEDTCAAGSARVRLLVESDSASFTRVRAGEHGARCSDGTAVSWQSIDRATLDLPAQGWAVLVGVVHAPKTSLLRGCTGWLAVEGGDEGASVPLGRLEFALDPEPTALCIGCFRDLP